MSNSKRRLKSLNQLVTRAQKDPRLALDRGWHLKSGFCDAFFDRCEHLAFVSSPAALGLALRAVEMAETHGEPHRIHRSHGVLSHAYLARRDPYWAQKTLDGVRYRALTCCRRCRSDYFRREGDVLGEQRQAKEALRALERSLREGGPRLDADTIGRILYVRGVAHYFDCQRRRAIDDAGGVLHEVSLDSPRGYFLDALALLIVYVGGGDESHDAAALDHINRFIARIRDVRRWQDVRTRAFWALGHLHARLGDMRRALDYLESARVRLLADGLAREIVAATIDAVQLRSRHALPTAKSLEISGRSITNCLELRQDLTPAHREGLEEMLVILEDHPEDAFEELDDFRRSFIVPVPGRLSERLRRRRRRAA